MRRAEIPSDVLTALSKGHIQTANLVEWLAIDQSLLFQETLGSAIKVASAKNLLNVLVHSQELSVNAKMRSIGCWFGQHASEQELASFLHHPSDMVRGWMAYAWVAKSPEADINTLLHYLKPFADDGHFSVREVAWMALRPSILNKTLEALESLLPWAHDKAHNLRRFACEATRPRGVWCAHILLLKQQPELAEKLLFPLRHDPEKYVQLSLGNWLNDAAKTRPDWVRQFVSTIDTQQPGAALIVKRALRSLEQPN
jgi:3-methyladenine DNA glycosylase AlkC